MKRYFLLIIIACIGLLATQCGSNPMPADKNAAGPVSKDNTAVREKTDTVVMLSGINSKGVGRFKDIKLANPLDERMAVAGQAIYESKCFACHKLSTELLVGPGWTGVTKRRAPEWIMNWITNTKIMLDKDLAAQAEMAICLIRMPSQDLNDEQARDVMEFMRKNDGQK